MRVEVYHQNGSGRAISKATLRDVVNAVRRCKVIARASSTTTLKKAIGAEIRSHGWSGKVMLGTDSNISVTSLRNRTALCVQTGNIARMYADLLKLQALFANGRIDSGILVLPEAVCAREIGSNIANTDRLLRELKIFGRVVTLPVAIIGFSNATSGSTE